MNRPKKLHVVSTNQQTAEKLIQVIALIYPYVDAIHIREKTWPANKVLNIVHNLYMYGVPREKIIINDRVDVAKVMKVSGVHLAKHSLDVSHVKETFPTLKVGTSVHSIKEALIAQEAGADYCIYGHVFPTASKATLPARGLDQLNSLIDKVSVPVIAIGGISEANVNDVLQTGVYGVAVMSGVFLDENPLKSVLNIRKNMALGR